MDSLCKPDVKSYLNFQVGVDKIFKPKCIPPNAEDITAFSN